MFGPINAEKGCSLLPWKITLEWVDERGSACEVSDSSEFYQIPQKFRNFFLS